MKETFQGRTVWDRVVEVFELVGHPKAPKVYAWAHDTDNLTQPRHHVTVLHVHPVTSAVLAVRAAIVQEFRNKQKAKKAGRPPLPKGNAKVGTLRVRVTPDELRTIESKAKAGKQTVSEWIRSKLNAAI